MKSYKQILFFLFILSQAIVAVANVVFEGNIALYNKIHRYQIYFMIAIAFVTVVFEIIYRNRKDVSFERQVNNPIYKRLLAGRKKWIVFLVGISLIIIGLLISIAFETHRIGNLITNFGVLIQLVGLYFIAMEKPPTMKKDSR